MEHEIVFLDRESVGADVRSANFPHNYTEHQSTWTPEDIVDRLKDATIAIINKVPMREDVLKQLPKLKLIAVAATGTDVVDKIHELAGALYRDCLIAPRNKRPCRQCGRTKSSLWQKQTGQKARKSRSE